MKQEKSYISFNIDCRIILTQTSTWRSAGADGDNEDSTTYRRDSMKRFFVVVVGYVARILIE